MNKILAIAHNTFREAIRQKLLYGLVFFTVLLIFATYFLGQLSIIESKLKIVEDMGLATIFIMGVFISLSMGISLVFKEIDRRTIYTILSKPVSRLEFIMGKFFGLIFTVGVQLFLMMSLLFLLLSTYPEPLDWNLWKAAILIFTELCILVSITLMFSSYSSSFMTSLFCFSLLIVGHLTDDVALIIGKKIKEIDQPEFAASMSGMQKIFQVFNLDHFAINDKIVHGVPISWSYVGYGILYGACFVFIFLLIANFLFSKKDLK